VDNERFQATADAARPSRAERLTSLGLDPQRPTVIFCGRLTDRKRPLDAVRAIEQGGGELNLLLLGDGPLREQVREYERRLPVRCLGFINQAELPAWYAAGDILVLPSESEVWGLVINEGLACGLIPVVSEAVGCAPDLVHGTGETFPVGDVAALAAALKRVASDVRDPFTAQDRKERLADRLAGFTVAKTAEGYEHAAMTLARR
jgi:glycosyltransferase involved in cell wall biosynthesis